MENNGLKFDANIFLYNTEKKEILLHKRDGSTSTNPYKWSFFSGRAEKDETPEECCIRELKEELGIVVNRDEMKSVVDYYDPERSKWHYTYYVESDLKKSQMNLSEGEDFDWISVKKVFDYDLVESARHDLITFLKK